MQFVNKEVVDAIQYQREENIHQVISWVGGLNSDQFVYKPVKNEYALLSLTGHAEILYKGDWLVRSHGVLSRYSDEAFKRAFGEITFEPNWLAMAQAMWHLGVMTSGQTIEYVVDVLKAASKVHLDMRGKLHAPGCSIVATRICNCAGWPPDPTEENGKVQAATEKGQEGHSAY